MISFVHWQKSDEELDDIELVFNSLLKCEARVLRSVGQDMSLTLLGSTRKKGSLRTIS